jgi:hypothetical protein
LTERLLQRMQSAIRRQALDRGHFGAVLHHEIRDEGLVRNKAVYVAHKSQGSEYPAVVGQRKALAIAVKGARTRRRWSKLGEWLIGSTSPNAAVRVPPAQTPVADRQLMRETGRWLAEGCLKDPPLMKGL